MSLFFKNAFILTLFVISDYTHLSINGFKFETKKIDKQELEKYNLNSKIDIFSFYSYSLFLNEEILNKKVFEKLTTLFIIAQSIRMQTTVFKGLKQLKLIVFSLIKITSLFHNVDIKWLSYLNEDLMVDFNIINQTFIDSNSKFVKVEKIFQELTSYQEKKSYQETFTTLLDEDFCLFTDLPFKKLVYLIPNFIFFGKECSCTLTFIRLRLRKYGQYLNKNDRSIHIDRYINNCFDKSICTNETFIEEKINKTCYFNNNLSQINSDTNDDYVLSSFDISPIIETMKFVIMVILTPVACITGIFLNLVLIITLKKNSKNELKEKFYKFMCLNSKFNCLFSLLHLFQLMNFCLTFYDYFCSSIYQTYFAQYFSIIGIHFLSNAIKMCSNLIYIQMTLNRYMLIGKDHFKILEKVSRIRIKYYLLVSLVLSLALNSIVFFEFSINDGSSSIWDDKDFPHLSTKINVETSGDPKFFMNIIKLVFNYFLIVFVNTTLECMIVYKLRQEIKKKEKRMREMMMMGFLGRAQSSEKTKKNKRREMKSILMISVNGVINLLLRFPECAEIFYFSFLQISFAKFFHAQLIDFFPAFILISNFFFILTFSSNFFVYYFFNQKIRESMIFFHSRKKGTKPK